MKKIMLIIGWLIVFNCLNGQEVDRKIIIKNAKEFLKNGDLKKSDSLYQIALKLSATKDVYEQLARISLSMGDTCEFCSRALETQKSGSNEFEKLYDKICIKDIKYPDSISGYQFICHKSLSCQRAPFQYFRIIRNDSTIRNFFLLDSNLNVDTRDYKKFPDFEHYYKNMVFSITDEQPEFVGGQQAQSNYFRRYLHYPADAANKGIQGTVFIRFIIDENGKTMNVELLRGVCPSIDQEAIRLVTSMPAWKPGYINSHPVKVQYYLPIRFALD